MQWSDIEKVNTLIAQGEESTLHAHLNDMEWALSYTLDNFMLNFMQHDIFSPYTALQYTFVNGSYSISYGNSAFGKIEGEDFIYADPFWHLDVLYQDIQSPIHLDWLNY